MARNMVMERRLILLSIIHFKDNGRMANKMDKVRNYGKMDQHMMAVGLTVIKRVMENLGNLTD